MKYIFKDKSIWIIIVMVIIVTSSSVVLGLGLFRLPAMKIGGLHLPVVKEKTSDLDVSSSSENYVDSGSVSSSSLAVVVPSSKKSSSVGNIISPSKISPSLVYLQNVEKIFNLKYPISTRAITINDLRSGQRTVSGHGFSFTESATSSITISNSQKIRGYLSTGLGVDLINSGNSGSGIVAYSNGIIFCSIFESLDIVLNTKSVEVRCTER